MRFSAALVAGLSFISASAHANPTAPELQAQGEELAKQGRFTEAIDSFKAADKLQASAAHACLIALAYTRRELWPQAEIWLATCKVRANPQDPAPDWAPAEQDQINERLAAAKVAAVEIEVQPPDAAVKLTVSSFAPDETFGPRTIHLPFGTHQIFAHAHGYKDESKTIEVTDNTAQHVVIQLKKPDVGPAVVPAKPRGEDPGKKLMLAGGVTVGAGFVTYAVLGYGWNTLRSANATDYPKSAFSSNGVYYGLVGATVGLWAIGTGLFAYGYVKHSHYVEEQTAIAVTPLPGGGMLSVGWSR